MNEKIELYKVRDFSDRINTVFNFVKQNGRQLAKNLLYFAPVYIIAGIINGFFQVSLLGESLYTMSSYDLMLTGGYLVSLLVNLLVTVTSFFAILYVISFVVEYELSEDGTVEDSRVWERVKGSVWGAIGGGILVGLAVITGFIFCIIPGIWLYISFSLFVPSYLNRERSMYMGVTDCMSDSFNLIKQDWFGAFGFLFVINIIVGICYAVFSFPAMIAGVVGALMPGGNVLVMLVMIVGLTLQNLGMLFFSAVSSVAVGILYFDYKERREGISLNKSIDNIGQDNRII